MTTQGLKSIEVKGLARSSRSIFACGADAKNRFSIFKGGRLYCSGENGDLADPDNFVRFLHSIEEMSARMRFSPELIAHDLHPMYFSSRVEHVFVAAARKGVQHHHAHVASVMAQFEIEQPIIGISFDGTGYGLDGNLWGGEFFVVSRRDCFRRAHFKYMKMPGGEMAIREPWRMIFGMLYEHLGDEMFEREFDFLRGRTKQECDFLKRAIDKNVNTPLTSSCGRLFDAVSSLLGLVHVAGFEAAAALSLEERASQVSESGSYDFDIGGKGTYVIGCGAMLDAMISDMAARVPVERIARRFHNSLAMLIVEIARRLNSELGLDTVALSGGVFQNRLLYERASRLLGEAGFTLLESRGIPLNDLGICVGQTFVALNSI